MEILWFKEAALTLARFEGKTLRHHRGESLNAKATLFPYGVWLTFELSGS
jgi:hypothetical protein